MKLNFVDWGIQGWYFFIAVALALGCCSHARSGRCSFPFVQYHSQICMLRSVAIEDGQTERMSLEVPDRHELSVSCTQIILGLR